MNFWEMIYSIFEIYQKYKTVWEAHAKIKNKWNWKKTHWNYHNTLPCHRTLEIIIYLTLWYKIDIFICIHMNNLHSFKYNNRYKCKVVQIHKNKNNSSIRDGNTVESHTCLLLIFKTPDIVINIINITFTFFHFPWLYAYHFFVSSFSTYNEFFLYSSVASSSGLFLLVVLLLLLLFIIIIIFVFCCFSTAQKKNSNNFSFFIIRHFLLSADKIKNKLISINNRKERSLC